MAGIPDNPFALEGEEQEGEVNPFGLPEGEPLPPDAMRSPEFGDVTMEEALAAPPVEETYVDETVSPQFAGDPPAIVIPPLGEGLQNMAETGSPFHSAESPFMVLPTGGDSEPYDPNRPAGGYSSLEEEFGAIPETTVAGTPQQRPDAVRTPGGHGIPAQVHLPTEPQRRRRGRRLGGNIQGQVVDVVEGSEAQAGLQEDADVAQAAAEQAYLTQAEIQALLLEQQADIYNQQALQQLSSAESIRERSLEVLRRREEQLGVLNEMNNELSRARMDPNRFYASRGPGAAIGASIAVALGALGSALTGGQNTALTIINDAIERDMVAQQNDFARRAQGITTGRNLYSDLVQALGDREQAELMFLDLKMQETESRIRSVIAQGASGQVLANAQTILAQLEAQRAETALQRDRANHRAVLQESWARAVPARRVEPRTRQSMEEGHVVSPTPPTPRGGLAPRARSVPGGGGTRVPAPQSTPHLNKAADSNVRIVNANGQEVGGHIMYDNPEIPITGGAGTPFFTNDTERNTNLFLVPAQVDSDGNLVPYRQSFNNMQTNRTERIGDDLRPVLAHQYFSGGTYATAIRQPTFVQRNGTWYQVGEEVRTVPSVGVNDITFEESQRRTESGVAQNVSRTHIVDASNPRWQNEDQADIIRQEQGLIRRYNAIIELDRLRNNAGFWSRLVGSAGQEQASQETQVVLNLLQQIKGAASDRELGLLDAGSRQSLMGLTVDQILGLGRGSGALRPFLVDVRNAINDLWRPYGATPRTAVGED